MDHFHPEDRPFIDRILEAASPDGRDFQFDARIILLDKSVRHIRCAGRPFINEYGLLEYVGTLLDVTDRKRTEESLRIAQVQLAHMARVTTMGELTASIVHEVNQPLAAVVTDGNAAQRWLARVEPNLDEARASLSRMVKEAKHASQVVTRIRAFIRNSQPVAATLDMNHLIDEVLPLIRHEIVRWQVSLRTELASDLYPTQGDPVQLRQVVVNLVMNAIEAINARAEGPRELLVSTRNQGSDQIIVSIRDSGIGFDPGSLDELFKPFVTTKANGMGMGLSISRSIVEAHGGKLSGAPNREHGATFRFSLTGV
jgi:C4-dicarboxylate-specific signal transduction histidine kinase